MRIWQPIRREVWVRPTARIPVDGSLQPLAGHLIDGEAAKRDGDCSQCAVERWCNLWPSLEYGDKYERPERPNLTFRCKSLDRGRQGSVADASLRPLTTSPAVERRFENLGVQRPQSWSAHASVRPHPPRRSRAHLACSALPSLSNVAKMQLAGFALFLPEPAPRSGESYLTDLRQS